MILLSDYLTLERSELHSVEPHLALSGLRQVYPDDAICFVMSIQEVKVFHCHRFIGAQPFFRFSGCMIEGSHLIPQAAATA